MDQKSKEESLTNNLVKTQTAWDGSALPYYPVGKPEIIINRITFPPHYVTK